MEGDPGLGAHSEESVNERGRPAGEGHGMRRLMILYPRGSNTNQNGESLHSLSDLVHAWEVEWVKPASEDCQCQSM